MKPSNVLIDEDGTLKISDFGLATLSKTNADDSLMAQYAARWNSSLPEDAFSSYMAPELKDGAKNYDRKIDIFSLGLIALEIYHPMSTQSEKSRVFSDVRSSRFPSFNSSVGEIIGPMLALKPENRPEASEIASWLQNEFDLLSK